MVTIKDYAASKGVSYEAVRKQIKIYAAELDGHIHKKNRTQYLDEEAIAFLDLKRSENPVIVMEASKDEELAQLREENKRLLLKIADLQDQIILKSNKIEMLQESNIQLLEAKTESKNKSWWQFW